MKSTKGKPNPAIALVILGITALSLYVLAQTAQDKIADAMSAGPAAITEKATIMDWPASEGAKMTVLRKGSNGWTCYPSAATTLAAGSRDAMCMDEVFQAWLEAYLSQTEPKLKGTGISYMLSSNVWGSNTDPFATAATANNQWHLQGPHLMMVWPDVNAYKGLSTDHRSGGPYVMYAGTPYVHLMVPVKTGK